MGTVRQLFHIVILDIGSGGAELLASDICINTLDREVEVAKQAYPYSVVVVESASQWVSAEAATNYHNRTQSTKRNIFSFVSRYFLLSAWKPDATVTGY